MSRLTGKDRTLLRNKAKKILSPILNPEGKHTLVVSVESKTKLEVSLEGSKYGASSISYAQLQKISQAFGTILIDFKQDTMPGSCPTCDYGATKETTLIIRDFGSKWLD